MTNEPLLQGLYWHDLDGIRARHAAGAHLDALDENGSTPLTEAILGGTGYPRVVKLLLELGADPSLEDGNGYTPWLACLDRQHDRVVETEQRRIRQLLEEHGASRVGEEHLLLQRAAAAGELQTVERMLDEGIPVQTRITSPLGAAVFGRHPAIAELLLQRGAAVDGQGPQDALTLLMHAAAGGQEDMARLLVAHGADVIRAVDGPQGIMTAAWYARSNGHEQLADWLAGLQPGAERAPIPRSALAGGPRAKFIELYQRYTSAPERGLSTEQIVKQLLKWDKAYGVSVFDVQVDRLNVSFEKLPEDTRKLAKDIVTLCPDVLEQGFASLGEALEHFAERAEPIPDDLAALCAGLDPATPDFPILALQRSLQLNRSVALWWD
ncbi:DUF4253 domain-containing protein [Pseudomonas mangrovi]|uniref:DUF4253 domain-containing protein n=1 Tax=Pseudomonas mangrovi TaxID=2161748 RepID=A0A2T5P5S3_9PSED|nr:ankyrin repeat domain-containing protein [Pseudomonas mangrovi]PTU73064.1 hypothetical protein DBO85_17620 [Pseudomonas mangrovi]